MGNRRNHIHQYVMRLQRIGRGVICSICLRRSFIFPPLPISVLPSFQSFPLPPRASSEPLLNAKSAVTVFMPQNLTNLEQMNLTLSDLNKVLAYHVVLGRRTESNLRSMPAPSQLPTMEKSEVVMGLLPAANTLFLWGGANNSLSLIQNFDIVLDPHFVIHGVSNLLVPQGIQASRS